MDPRRIPPCLGIFQVFVLLVSTSDVAPTEPLMPCSNDRPYWFQHNRFCYGTAPRQLIWEDAEDICKANNAHLVSVNSESESNFLIQLLEQSDIEQGRRVWLGMILSEGTLIRKNDNSPSNYENWGDVRPENFSHMNACISMVSQTGKWHIDKCDTYLDFVCKSSTSTISSNALLKPMPLLKAECPFSWIPFGTKCFLPMRENGATILQTWQGAVESCLELGAKLASIHSIEEQNVLSGLLHQLKDNAWIGLHDTFNESVFEWMDNTDLDFTYWAPNEPFGAFHTSDCVELWYNNEAMGRWRDYSCDINKAYICQKAADSTFSTMTSVTNASSNPPPTAPPSTSGTSPPSTPPMELCGEESKGWYFYNGYCYMLPPMLYSFDLAEKNCRKDGGHLTSIHSSDESAFIQKLISNKKIIVWIGLNSNSWDNKPQWLDGETIRYTKWNDGQPKTILNNEKCTAISSSSGKWQEENCYIPHNYVCKRPSRLNVSVVLDNDCPPGWHSFGKRCFLPMGKDLENLETWDKAMKKCVALGGQLASIHNMEEQNALSGLLLTLGQEAWIGLHDTIDESKFQWTDGTNLDFQFWAPHEPMAVLEKSDCVELWYRGQNFAQWRDFSCDVSKAYICQRNKDSSPTQITPSEDFCPPDFQSWEYGKKELEHCYLIQTNDLVMWASATYECFLKDGDILSIHSEYEMAVVAMNLEQVKEPVWIGLSRNNDGSFEWFDGTTMNFVLWEGAEPSSLRDGCVAIDPVTLQWKVLPCTNKLGYICKANIDTNSRKNKKSSETSTSTTDVKRWNIPTKPLNISSVAERQRKPKISTEDKSSGLSPSGVGAIVVVCLLLIVCITVLGFIYLRRQRFRSLLPSFSPEPMGFDNVMYNKDQLDKPGDSRF